VIHAPTEGKLLQVWVVHGFLATMRHAMSCDRGSLVLLRNHVPIDGHEVQEGKSIDLGGGDSAAGRPHSPVTLDSSATGGKESTLSASHGRSGSAFDVVMSWLLASLDRCQAP
jgi:hypothetical protein